MMKLTVLIVVLCLCGCAQLMKGETQPVIAKGGNLFTTCSGAVEDWSSCTNKAKKSCPNGYEVLEKAESSVGGRRELTFKCK